MEAARRSDISLTLENPGHCYRGSTLSSSCPQWEQIGTFVGIQTRRYHCWPKELGLSEAERQIVVYIFQVLLASISILEIFKNILLFQNPQHKLTGLLYNRRDQDKLDSNWNTHFQVHSECWNCTQHWNNQEFEQQIVKSYLSCLLI